ncbi:hypothetical protein STVIR_6269 [Streptomyces viridochromogenes Tue57]|uniref:Uncharacterized protein n=1 Tax=Streptomyces viridochromogenes Tue57 TaxID=1160705 RepID=L8P5C9_STRVR|nr:hypothetical protein STVIR_6269 [Streptomyces viridochromogenes Tue57]
MFAYISGLATVLLVHAMPAPELALRRALLPQSAALSFPFTVEEVVRMGRARRCCCSTNRPRRWICGIRSWCCGCAGSGRGPGTPWWSYSVFSERLLSEVYDQPVEVLPHPRTGVLLVTPLRNL